MKRVGIYIVAFLLTFYANAQPKSGVMKGELQIGEQTELIYEFSFTKKDEKLSFIPLQNEIKCIRYSEVNNLTDPERIPLEIIGNFNDSTFQKNGRFIWEGKYTITAWDTGYFVIPPTTISTQDSVYEFAPILIRVTSPITDPNKEIYDIKEQFFELPTDYFAWFKENYTWLLPLIAIVLIAIFWWIRKKRKNEIPVKELSLKEKTLLAIDALDAAQLWEKDKLKEHYTELSFILRSYLSARYGLNLLEKTSFQTTILLKKQGLANDTIETIQTILNQADLVKFAKSKPNSETVKAVSTLAKQIVAETSPIEFKHV
jgi:hypothetical protein